VHDAVDIQPDNHLIRMPIHGRLDVGGLGHGVGLPHGAGLLGQYEVMRLAEPIQARHVVSARAGSLRCRSRTRSRCSWPPFIEKFGREPGPDDPVFLDPDKALPTPIGL
jgi:hypothetical protein